MLNSLCGPAGRCSSAAAPSFVRLAKHRASRGPWSTRQGCVPARWQTSAAAVSDATGEAQISENLSKISESRRNSIGIQGISKHVYDQVFPRGDVSPPSDELINLSRAHLQQHELLNKNSDTSAPIAFDLPPLVGANQTLDEHFYLLGTDAAEPFLTLAKEFSRIHAPPKPRKWVRKSGWTKYPQNGDPVPVNAPDANMLSFDTEVMWKEHRFAVMACAVSPDAWYAWLSPWLLGETENERQLIPLGDPSKERVIVGHNIGYDRARTLEEYDLKQTRNAFLDTMSLHVAVNGMCSQQRPTWMKHKKNREKRDQTAKMAGVGAILDEIEDEEELWVERSSINSLRDVAQFHLKIALDKQEREAFGELDRDRIVDRLEILLDYCAADVDVTHRVYKKTFRNFIEVCPHPVSFAALRHLSTVVLPIDKTWESYIQTAEATYLDLLKGVQERLESLAEKAVAIKDDPEKWAKDAWLQQLDWSGQEIKYNKPKKKGELPKMTARQKLPGKPKWYKDLFKKSDSAMSISVRTRIAPLLLRLSWEGYPLFWSDKYGWTFRVPLQEAPNFGRRNMTPCDLRRMEGDKDSAIDDRLRNDREHAYFRVPHKDGPQARCATPMAKGYLCHFEKGILSSEYSYAKEALEMNASCSYWISARERIKSQMAVYQDDLNALRQPSSSRTGRANSGSQGFILPQVIPMGTITRRAVEKTWLTASNAKSNRVGSELKAMIRAPPGYVFVGADVDSEELWIASLLGDATFKMHGGNAIGFMTLEGTKAAGTDMHSHTASILGITRNNAKVFNYGRIYGAGLKFAAQLLRQFNPTLSEKETVDIATKLYASTKGTKTSRKALHKRTFWRGGTESLVFNKLEEFAGQDKPRTPVLGAGITEALMSRYIGKSGYLPSRINWAIQSSGVDYLHLLIISMDYLTRRYNLSARLAITVHDEIRYLVKEHDKYRAAMALQVANLWTRAMFSEQVGIYDLPQSCAFFSAVDIDHVLRKEVDMDCLTPSNRTPIPPGESLDINQILAKGCNARLDPSIVPEQYGPCFDGIQYTPRTRVMEQLEENKETAADPEAKMRFIRAQIAADDRSLRGILKEMRKTPACDSRAKTIWAKKVQPYVNQPQLEPVPITHAVSQSYQKSAAAGGGKRMWERGAKTPHHWARV